MKKQTRLILFLLFLVLTISLVLGEPFIGTTTSANMVGGRSTAKIGNDYVVVVSREGGVGVNSKAVIFDVSTPSNPIEINDFSLLDDQVSKVYRYNDTAVLITHWSNSGEIGFWDLTNPLSPVRRSYFDYDGGAITECQWLYPIPADNLVFCSGRGASNNGNLYSINYANPASPTVLDTETGTTNYYTGMVVIDETRNMAYLSGTESFASVNHDVFAVNISNPSILLRTYESPETIQMGYLYLNYPYLYTWAWNSAFTNIYDVTNPTSLSLVVNQTTFNAISTVIENPNFPNYPVIVRGNVLELYNLTNPTSPTIAATYTNSTYFSGAATNFIKYGQDGNYFYLTSGNRISVYSLDPDVWLGIVAPPVPNQYPTWDLYVSDTTPNIGQSITVQAVNVSDNEGDTIYYAINCDFETGDPNPTYSTVSSKSCSYGTSGRRVIRYFVTDSNHTTADYTQYNDATIYVGLAGTYNFFESFGPSSWSMGQPSANWQTSRPATWIQSQKAASSSWDNQWYWYASGLGDRINPSNNLAYINTAYGLLYHGYTFSTGQGAIGYVHDTTFRLRDTDVIDFYCTDAGGASGLTTLTFQQEDGQGGVCLHLRTGVADCAFSDSVVGCHGNYDTACVIVDCLGETDRHHTITVSSLGIPEANRDNLKIIEYTARHSGGGFGDPNVDIMYLDDLSISFQEYDIAGTVCGDASCDIGETYLTCPADCDSYCGDGICDGSQENSVYCPADCPASGGYVEQTPKEEQVEQVVCNPGVEYNIGETKIITEYETIETPYYVREKTSANTCGIDADQDGIMCDLNEDFISCSEDCSFNVAEVLCISNQRCMWTESWFIQVIILIQLMMLLYMIYLMWLQ